MDTSDYDARTRILRARTKPHHLGQVDEARQRARLVAFAGLVEKRKMPAERPIAHARRADLLRRLVAPRLPRS